MDEHKDHHRYNVRADARARLARAAGTRLSESRSALDTFLATSVTPKRTLEPADLSTHSNPLRPASLSEMVGQPKLKPLLRRLIDNALASGTPLAHVLLVGASGTGKSTTALVIARELGRRVFLLKAPVDMGTLLALQESSQPYDCVFVDEIHMMASGDRRGRTESCDPENFFLLLEDGVLMTRGGARIFPPVTWIGATTDVGLLPEPLANRFPLQPRLEAYTVADMEHLAMLNAQALDASIQADAAKLMASASRCNPRQLNSYMKMAVALGGVSITCTTAREVVVDLSSTTLDGLDASMQAMLRYLYKHGRRQTKDGVVYQASAGALATAAGHGRDVKTVYAKEAYLIEQGLLSVQPRGRTLTDAGVERARELV